MEKADFETHQQKEVAGFAVHHDFQPHIKQGFHMLWHAYSFQIV